jgi:hypothetical protein
MSPESPVLRSMINFREDDAWWSWKSGFSNRYHHFMMHTYPLLSSKACPALEKSSCRSAIPFVSSFIIYTPYWSDWSFFGCSTAGQPPLYPSGNPT